MWRQWHFMPYLYNSKLVLNMPLLFKVSKTLNNEKGHGICMSSVFLRITPGSRRPRADLFSLECSTWTARWLHDRGPLSHHVPRLAPLAVVHSYSSRHYDVRHVTDNSGRRIIRPLTRSDPMAIVNVGEVGVRYCRPRRWTSTSRALYVPSSGTRRWQRRWVVRACTLALILHFYMSPKISKVRYDRPRKISKVILCLLNILFTKYVILWVYGFKYIMF